MAGFVYPKALIHVFEIAEIEINPEMPYYTLKKKKKFLDEQKTKFRDSFL